MKDIENDIAIISKIGGREENQDFALAFKSPLGTLLIVCDGAGGYNGGSRASKLAANHIINSFRNYNDGLEIKEYLVNAIIQANDEILKEGNDSLDLNGMKTTLAMVFVHNSVGISFHVGDSRVYQIRNGQIIFKSDDHSYVQELINQGKLSKKDAFSHPKSNVITRVLGASSKIEIDIKDLKVNQHDVFILTTDGIHGLLTDNQILSHVYNEEKIEDVCQKLSDSAELLGVTKKQSKHDNLTVLMYSNKFRKTHIFLNRKRQLISITFLVIFSIFLYSIRDLMWVKDKTIDGLKRDKLSLDSQNKTSSIAFPDTCTISHQDSCAIIK